MSCTCTLYILLPLLSQLPDSLSLSDFSQGNPPVVLTSDIQRNKGMISPWLQHDTKQPFLIVGPEGCGKELVP